MSDPIKPEVAERLARVLEREGFVESAMTMRALLAERDGANALIDRMHEQDVLAIKQWQAAHPGNDLQWPGQIRLTAWLMGEAAKVQAERDAALAEVKRMREALEELANLSVAEARNKALEEAARVVDSTVTYDQRAAGYAMRRIRALKEPDHFRDAAKMVQAREGGDV